MSEYVTDRDERMWQRRAEEPVLRPWGMGSKMREIGSKARDIGSTVQQAGSRTSDVGSSPARSQDIGSQDIGSSTRDIGCWIQSLRRVLRRGAQA